MREPRLGFARRECQVDARCDQRRAYLQRFERMLAVVRIYACLLCPPDEDVGKHSVQFESSGDRVRGHQVFRPEHSVDDLRTINLSRC